MTPGKDKSMMLLTVPLALAALAGLLSLASHLEQHRARALVRMSVRSKATPEQTESLIANELAPVLAAAGLTDRLVSRQ